MTAVSDSAPSEADGAEKPSQWPPALHQSHIDASHRQQSKNHTTMPSTVQLDHPPSSPVPATAATPVVKGTPRLNLDALVQPPIRPRDYAMQPPVPGSETPSATDSLSPSESESWSVPSTRPPSQAPSRAPSVSTGIPGIKPFVPPSPTHQQQQPQPQPQQAQQRRPSTASAVPSTAGQTTLAPSSQNQRSRAPTAPSSPQPPSTPARARSSSNAHSDSGRFSISNFFPAPKLTRKSSGRSIGSSRKSDSDGERKSVTGESAVSLTQKYGVCQKVAIGKGATSVVRLAHKWDRTEEKLYAVKEFRKRRKNESEKEYVKKLTAEFCISSTLHHVNIVETVDLVQDENKQWCEVMEFCPGGDLYAAIKKGHMSPSEVECCFKQILTGVSYLHSQGVAHRDIKPENLFFDTQGHLKIGDYGASTVYRLPWESTIHMSTGLCGSEPYIAPEQFLGKPYDARLVDIWACGVVYYCLHFEEMPWRVAQTSDTLYAAYAQACTSHPLKDPHLLVKDTHSVSSGTSASSKDKESHTSTASLSSSREREREREKEKEMFYPATISNLSPRACRSLIRKMLEPDPKKRTFVEEVMAHPWVVGIEVCHLMEEPRHVHSHAMAQAQAQLGSGGRES
ncbi:Pkinase-domain-containing protein [Scleroderma citrinum]